MPDSDAFRPDPAQLPVRPNIPIRYTWDLSAICRDWEEWQRLYESLDDLISRFVEHRGTDISAHTLT